MMGQAAVGVSPLDSYLLACMLVLFCFVQLVVVLLACLFAFRSFVLFVCLLVSSFVSCFVDSSIGLFDCLFV